MKSEDPSTPIYSPSLPSNALNTPNRLGISNHYFAPSHHALSLNNSGQGFEGDHLSLAEALLGKLQLSESGQIGSLIDSIPDELVSLILECGFFDGPFPDTEFRSLLLKLSHRFRQTTIHTPSVWSVIHLSQGNVNAEIDHLSTYLERSMDYPLDIQLSCFWGNEMTDSIMNLLVPYIRRWRRLSIVTMNDYILLPLLNTQFPMLEDLDISFYSYERRISLPSPIFGGNTPRLSHLSLRNINVDNLDMSFRELRTLEIRGYGTWPTFSRFNEMLGGSNCLESLTLHVKPGQILHQLYPEPSNIHGQIILPNLQVFEIYTSEWLSPQIVLLISVFSLPKLQSLKLHEGVGSASQTARTIMSYATVAHLPKDTRLSYPPGVPLCTGFPNRLFVQSAYVNLACQALSATTLTSLELQKILFPRYETMKTTFSALKNLQHLFLLDVNISEVLLQIFGDVERVSLHEHCLSQSQSSIIIPSLETLMLDFNHPISPLLPKDYSAHFLRLFSLPSLRSLIFKNLKAFQWKSIVDSCSQHPSQYPLLNSLKVIDMADILPTASDHPHYNDLADVFPHLRRLSLDAVHSNSFIRQLMPRLVHDSSTPWPALDQLSICNDANVSKPLLHRVINARESMGKPLQKLCLDAHFSTNKDSWDWIREHVKVTPAEFGYL